jgi:hypothetical protein
MSTDLEQALLLLNLRNAALHEKYATTMRVEPQRPDSVGFQFVVPCEGADFKETVVVDKEQEAEEDNVWQIFAGFSSSFSDPSCRPTSSAVPFERNVVKIIDDFSGSAYDEARFMDQTAAALVTAVRRTEHFRSPDNNSHRSASSCSSASTSSFSSTSSSSFSSASNKSKKKTTAAKKEKKVRRNPSGRRTATASVRNLEAKESKSKSTASLEELESKTKLTQIECVRLFRLSSRFRIRDVRRRVLTYASETLKNSLLTEQIQNQITVLPHALTKEEFANRLVLLMRYDDIFFGGSLFGERSKHTMEMIDRYCSPEEEM